MAERTGRAAGGWTVRLVRLQMAMRGARDAPADAEGTWTARLVHAGALLACAGGLLVAAWLRRHL